MGGRGAPRRGSSRHLSRSAADHLAGFGAPVTGGRGRRRAARRGPATLTRAAVGPTTARSGRCGSACHRRGERAAGRRRARPGAARIASRTIAYVSGETSNASVRGSWLRSTIVPGRSPRSRPATISATSRVLWPRAAASQSVSVSAVATRDSSRTWVHAISHRPTPPPSPATRPAPVPCGSVRAPSCARSRAPPRDRRRSWRGRRFPRSGPRGRHGGSRPRPRPARRGRDRGGGVAGGSCRR